MAPFSSYPTGVAYFRPPNPPRPEHARHLKTIKHELGFDAVRLRLQWNAIHRKPHAFDWGEYDEIVDRCESLGLGVMLETSLESAPYWLERLHPEARYVSANGREIDLGGYESTQYGGYPGLCIHHPATREQGRRYLESLATHFADRSCVAIYDCWNEPHLEPAWISNYWANTGDQLFCYCTKSKLAFREWLRRKYESIDAINATWGRSYGEWDDINPPNRHGTYADWLDWGRFWFDELRGEMQWRYDVIRSVDTRRPIMSHSGAVPPFLARAPALIHNWKLASIVDIWGTSYAPKAHNWRLSECAGTMDVTRSAARGKPYWISEMSGGATNSRGFWKAPPPQPIDYRVWNWLAVCYGAKATFYWCYLEESTGPEAGGFGMVRANGEVTPRARSAAETARVLRDNWPTIRNYLPDPRVGILYDPDNSQQLFAMDATDELYVQSHIGFYRTIWNCDLFARYLTYNSLDDLSSLSVLIVPMCLTLSEPVASTIRDWVKNGGTLLCEARTGLFDERGYNQPVLPSYGLADVFGIVEQEALCSDPSNRPRLNNLRGELWPEPYHSGVEIAAASGPRFRAYGYFVPLTPTTAEVIARSDHHCLASMNRYGSGRAYYVGTYLGLALFHHDSGADLFLRSILSPYAQPIIRGDKLRPRLIPGKNECLLAVFNDARDVAQSDFIEVPTGFGLATDVYSQEWIEIVDRRLELEVAPESVRVFRLTIR